MKITLHLLKGISTVLVVTLAVLLVSRLLPVEFGLLHAVMERLPEENFVLANILVVMLVGSLLKMFTSRSIQKPWEGDAEVIVGQAVLAVVLARYFSLILWGQSGSWDYFLWASLSLLLMLLVPNVVDFMTEKYTVSGKWGRTISSVSMGLALIVLVVSYGVVGFIQYQRRAVDTYVYTHPVITSFEPHIVTTWNKIIIRGNGFGTRLNDNYRVEYGSGQHLLIDYWSNNEIIIEMSVVENPLKIRVVRPSNYNGKVEDRVSNSITLEFYEVGRATSEQQRHYFEQLNNMSDEAKKLYGINTF